MWSTFKSSRIDLSKLGHQKHRVLPYKPKMPAVKPYSPLAEALKQNNLMTSSQLQKQQAQRPPPRISNNNFPENRLQLDRHHLAVAQARPNPANAFR